MAMKRNPQSRRSLRVLTANLYADRLNVEAFQELLKEIDPDVAMVQELSFAAAEILGRLLPHGLLIPEEGHDGRGLALKAPAEMERLPMAYRDGLIARLEAPAWHSSLEIVNIHMMNPILWPPWNASRLRSQQLGVLLAHLEAPGARLVGGDFNASPVWPVYRRLAGRLDDAALLVAKENGRSAARTWGPTPDSPRLLRIDHVFVEGLRPVDVRRVEIPGSDHSGLLVDIDLG